MNKKITVLAFAIFAGSIEINAMGQRDGGGRDSYHDNNSRSVSPERLNTERMERAVAAHKSMHNTISRDEYGFSNTGDEYIDAYRNEPRNGGPTNEQYIKAASDTNFCNRSYVQRAKHIIHRLNFVGIADWTSKEQQRNGGPRITSRDETIAAARFIEMDRRITAAEQLAAAQTSKAVTVQTQAKTKEEEFAIAKKVVETSPELQAYAAALFAARK